jgi:curli production assembly/transport component CsgG
MMPPRVLGSSLSIVLGGRTPWLLACAAGALLTACASRPATVEGHVELTPPTEVTRDLAHLPPPRGKIVAAVYSFRDQTGQYRAAPDSSFSSQVTQGGASFLIKALADSGWFIPVERDNLQDLLTERKILRALETPEDKSKPIPAIGMLLPANVIIEGGVIAYDSNVRTGGVGVAYLGLRASQQYSVDQVTVNLRTVDIHTGQILNSVSTTKTVYSYEVSSGVFRYIGYQVLLQAEAGLTRNEPQQLCVKAAIEAAVAHLIVQGLQSGNWALKNTQDWNDPTVQKYVLENQDYRQSMDAMQTSPLVSASRRADSSVPSSGH